MYKLPIGDLSFAIDTKEKEDRRMSGTRISSLLGKIAVLFVVVLAVKTQPYYPNEVEKIIR
jgi:hypothetical protein